MSNDTNAAAPTARRSFNCAGTCRPICAMGPGHCATTCKLAEPAPVAAPDVSPSEAVAGFAAFLTCWAGSLTIGAGHDAAPMAELVQAYSRSQGWAGPREDFASRLRRGVEAALPTQPAEAAQAEAWRELFFRVAAALQCLPSTFPDELGNAHVLRAAQEAQATREAMRQPAAALDRDTLARLARQAGAHAYTNRFAASEPAFAFSIERLETFVGLVLAAATAAQPVAQVTGTPDGYRGLEWLIGDTLTHAELRDRFPVGAKLYGAMAAAQQPAEPAPLTLEYIEQHIGTDEGDRDAVRQLVREVEAAHNISPAAGATVQPDACCWTEDPDGTWTTACGDAWQFTEGGTPAEHGARFCFSCGKPLEATSHVESDEDDGANADQPQQSEPLLPPAHCQADRDGDCDHQRCPQLRDGEPAKSGRSCPLYASGGDDEA